MSPMSSLVGRMDATGALAGRALGALVVAFIALALLLPVSAETPR